MEFSVEIASILSRFLARQPEFGINFRESEEYLWWDHERHKLTFEFGPHNPTPTVVLVTNLVPDENADPTALARIAELILLEASCLT
ncbi:MAG: hypothetical protein MUD10_04160 [Candidatus Pacebacteria bacterium]|nr:hypothetical protein [Candidatus Paceibacterota bacterium]